MGGAPLVLRGRPLRISPSPHQLSCRGQTEQDIRKLDNIVVQARGVARRTAKPEAGCDRMNQAKDWMKYRMFGWCGERR
ncbi:hypothetical protein BRAO375_4940049 [Bradyrhizobium sp. ORS 375]|nr:hypothetical protein BRAO375_4940049 [Bradyrhizobium sp. ORS 375]